MDSDKELLILVAKTAGMHVSWWEERGAFVDKSTLTMWNPLTDDGDAFRLAVKLMEFEPYKGRGNLPLFSSSIKNTRRAIVQAAANIGKDMP